MNKARDERNFDVVLDTALKSRTSYLDHEELVEVFRRRSGEAELNDLLRHALNRIVRDRGWIAEREVSDRAHGLTRVDLAVTDVSSGWATPARLAWLEAKLQYPANAFLNPGVFIGLATKSSAADVRKLSASLTATPKYVLTWVPHVKRSLRPVKYARGHLRQGAEWVADPRFDGWRDEVTRLLAVHGPTRVLPIRDESSDSGDVILHAWVTQLRSVPG